MDAATREERRLMRQRGAGNRSAKAIDFGFSFGTPRPPPKKATHALPKPAPEPAVREEPAETQQPQEAQRVQEPQEPAAETPVPSVEPASSASIHSARSQGPARLTPVRKSLTPRKSSTPVHRRFGESSPFDIPPDEDAGQGRSDANEEDSQPKRRRISSHETTEGPRSSIPSQQTSAVESSAKSASSVEQATSVTSGIPADQHLEFSQQETRRGAEPAAAQTNTSPRGPLGLTPERIDETIASQRRNSGQKSDEASKRKSTDDANVTEAIAPDAQPSADDMGSHRPGPSPEATDAVVSPSGKDGQANTETRVEAISPVPTPGDTVSEGIATPSNQQTELDSQEHGATSSVALPEEDETSKQTKQGLRKRVLDTVRSSASRVVDKFKKRKREPEPSTQDEGELQSERPERIDAADEGSEGRRSPAQVETSQRAQAKPDKATASSRQANAKRKGSKAIAEQNEEGQEPMRKRGRPRGKPNAHESAAAKDFVASTDRPSSDPPARSKDKEATSKSAEEVHEPARKRGRPRGKPTAPETAAAKDSVASTDRPSSDPPVRNKDKEAISKSAEEAQEPARKRGRPGQKRNADGSATSKDPVLSTSRTSPDILAREKDTEATAESGVEVQEPTRKKGRPRRAPNTHGSATTKEAAPPRNRLSPEVTAPIPQYEHVGQQDDFRQGSSEQIQRRSPRQPDPTDATSADVLRRLCDETIEDTLSSLHEALTIATNKKTKAELRHKVEVVHAFRRGLREKLGHTGRAAEANEVSSPQEQQKEQELAKLQARLEGIEKKRTEIGLEKDEIRRRFIAEEEEANHRLALTNALHDLELMLERPPLVNQGDDSENPAAGLEFLLRSVAANVSSTAPGSQGGLLRQMKEFNKQLEREIAELEGR